MNDESALVRQDGFEIPTDWTFRSNAVARNFDRHVRTQLPWYALLTGAVAHIARHYIPENGLVYDLGASTGNIGRAIEDVLDTRCATFVPIEASAEMCAVYDGPQRGRLLHADIREIDFAPFDFATAFLVMMFLPLAERRDFLARLTRAIRPGGALVVVDKFVGPGGYEGTVLARLTLAGKLASGVEPSEIVAKELSLAGVQRPMTPDELPPGAIEFFRMGEFAGYLVAAP